MKISSSNHCLLTIGGKDFFEIFPLVGLLASLFIAYGNGIPLLRKGFHRKILILLSSENYISRILLYPYEIPSVPTRGSHLWLPLINLHLSHNHITIIKPFLFGMILSVLIIKLFTRWSLRRRDESLCRVPKLPAAINLIQKKKHHYRWFYSHSFRWLYFHVTESKEITY